MKAKKAKGLSAAELSSFCGQVAMILEAGLPLYDGMETLAGTESGGTHQEMYAAVSRGVTETGSLYEALKAGGRWPGYLVEMAQVGEKSGRLSQVLRGLETHYEREGRIRSSVASAVTYPLVLGGMLVLIVLILLWRVLPTFRRVLDSMGGGTGDTGSVMMRLGVTVGWVVLVLVALVVIAVLIGALLLRTRHRDRVIRFVQQVFPPYRQLKKKLSASRVAGVLSMMLKSGFPADEALEMASRVLLDEDAARKVESVKTGMDQGREFAETLSQAQIFDELHGRMIKMGAATGREDQVLEKLADLNEEEAEERISHLVSIIEPTLVALLSVVIGAVLLSVMLPMAGILSTL